MSYNKNTAGQKFNVLAVNSGTGLPVTGDAANITAQISKDFGAFVSLTDTNPTELDSTNAPGVYVFDLSQAETNADVLTIVPTSTTANVEMDMLNIYTTDISATQLNDIEDQVGNILVDTTAIDSKTSQLTFTVANQVDANALTGGTSAADIYTYFTTGTNEDAFKADVSLLSLQSTLTSTASDITAIKGKTDQFVFTVANQVDANSLTGGLTQSEVADAVWDELLTGATHNIPTSAGKRLRQVADIGVYEGGQVWIDTVNGTAGTASYENGTVDLPSDNIADATTLATAVAITRFKIAPNSNFTLASDYTGFNFSGDGKWTLGLGGRDLNKTTIIHATVSGTCTSSNEPHFEHCEIGTVTLPACSIVDSRLTDTITLSSAGTYSFDHCVSGVAGTGSPVIDFGAAVGNTNLNMRHYSGGIRILNMGQLGTDNMSLEGNGALTIDATCVGGTIALRGNFKVTDNSGGAVTIVKDDNSQILTTAAIDGYTLEEALKLCASVLAGKVSGAGTNTITFRAVDDSKDRVVATVAGEGNRTSVTIDVTG